MNRRGWGGEWRSPGARPRARPSRFILDPEVAPVEFVVSRPAAGELRGRFWGCGGTLELGEGEPATASMVVRLTTATIRTGSAVLDRYLCTPAVLDAAHHPAITFRSRNAEADGPGRFRIAGELALRGVHRAVGIDATLARPAAALAGPRVLRLTGTTTLHARAFGLPPPLAAPAGPWAPAAELGVRFVLEWVEVGTAPPAA
ncbi:MAG TPA: YceI family protein [Longimicrobiales bacterium]|nr:YceI family protein [Longimicrobiales bacterium]